MRTQSKNNHAQIIKQFFYLNLLIKRELQVAPYPFQHALKLMTLSQAFINKA
jgi:poly(3-hydroxyalkanoate) synthetase